MDITYVSYIVISSTISIQQHVFLNLIFLLNLSDLIRNIIELNKKTLGNLRLPSLST